MRKAFHRSINRWDACKSLIVIDKRLEVLHENKRCKRKYEKANSSFWEGGKAAIVRNLPRISLPEKSPYPSNQVPEPATERTNAANQNENSPPSALPYSQEQLQRMTVLQLRQILVDTTTEPVNKRSRKPMLIDSILELNRTHLD